ncbi:DUF3892 domain-containing protein [Lacticaseibacillus paracasei]|jgi:hypothetical protein|uniref:DUF3892 domain-containing protein n=1 Tax=Lacticaseibacillus paracasei TaxID=1597 RepID=UPI0021A4B75B|nr:DUF3892 domain-containing protein [Lacticaseibacillus paracasei]
MIYASKIQMNTGKEHNNELISIKSIYLEGLTESGFYTKESIYDWLKNNSDIEVRVKIEPYPRVQPAIWKTTKYVKSQPDDTGLDNLLKLPREL